ncbi:hypothetical protein K438DRAFT_1784603 [Mycena galopus ATCC 62051]|nr:hypothetical protein K438DRAFT_1784603 [Mycena galopus ATCC 62051]
MEHNLEPTQKDVLSQRTKLGNMILAWRRQQKSIAPNLGDKVAMQAAASPAVPVEEEVLFLPSDLIASERLDLGVVALAMGTLIDGPNTSFPSLTVADTFMKSVWQTRCIGDSKFTDGLLWRVSETNLGASAELSGTQMHTRKPVPCLKVLAPGTVSRLEEKRQERTEGWLWQLGKMGRLWQNEMDEWSSEVQWFRAEGEMQRWQEQKEQKIVELLCTVRSFLKMQQLWTQLGNEHSSNQPGHAAYAWQKAAMYQQRPEEAQRLVRVGGYGFLLEPAANVIEYIEKEREKEKFFPGLGVVLSLGPL